MAAKENIARRGSLRRRSEHSRRICQLVLNDPELSRVQQAARTRAVGGFSDLIARKIQRVGEVRQHLTQHGNWRPPDQIPQLTQYGDGRDGQQLPSFVAELDSEEKKHPIAEVLIKEFICGPNADEEFRNISMDTEATKNLVGPRQVDADRSMAKAEGRSGAPSVRDAVARDHTGDHGRPAVR